VRLFRLRCWQIAKGRPEPVRNQKKRADRGSSEVDTKKPPRNSLDWSNHHTAPRILQDYHNFEWVTTKKRLTSSVIWWHSNQTIGSVRTRAEIRPPGKFGSRFLYMCAVGRARPGRWKRVQMPDQFDIVVAGAGHNSLIAAAYLAKAGYRCLVLESRALVGGGVKTTQLTLRGFKHDVCSSAHVLIQDSPILRNDELGLSQYGLEYLFPDPVVHLPFPDGAYITQWRDIDRTCEEFAKFSKKDAAAYRRMMTEYEEMKPIFGAASYTPVGFGKPLNERLTEHPKGKMWQRRLAMSAWEIIRDNFEEDHCRAFMVWMAYQTVEPPEAAATGRLAYSICAGRQRWSWTTPKGGSGTLTQALARLIEAHGGVILTHKTVTRLIVENGKCTGVECSDGSSYRGEKAVLSTIHIKHLVDMAPKEAFGEEFLEGVATWKAGITLFATHYASKEPPKFPVSGGTLTSVASGTMATPDRGLRVS
jgi:phytoene dehydrogenase-like protein